MSLPLTPYSRWESGTNQNSVPANDNALRSEIFNTDGIADDVTTQPSFTSPADDGKWYIIPVGATGAQWSAFGEDSVAIFYGGNWYEFTPVQGNKLAVAGVMVIYDETGGWEPITVPAAATWGAITGSIDDQSDLVAAMDAVDIVTEATASTMEPDVHSGRRRYVRAGGDVTFDSAEGYAAGQVFNIRATSEIVLLEDGVTLTPPSGGSLVLDADMAVTVIMTSGIAGDVIGQTVAAS